MPLIAALVSLLVIAGMFCAALWIVRGVRIERLRQAERAEQRRAAFEHAIPALTPDQARDLAVNEWCCPHGIPFHWPCERCGGTAHRPPA